MAEGEVDARIPFPSNLCIWGPTGAGKTTFLHNLLEEKEKHFKLQGPLQSFGSPEQGVFDKFKEKGVKCYRGMSDTTYLARFFNHYKDEEEDKKATFLIFDDLMHSF